MKFKTQKKEHHYYTDEICIDGHWFELYDLINTLERVEDEDIWIRNSSMAEALKKRRVLATSGSRNGYAARIGPNYYKFLARMIEYKRIMNPTSDDEDMRYLMKKVGLK